MAAAHPALGLLPGSFPSPGPGAAPPPAAAELPPSRAGFAADGLALSRAPGYSAHPPDREL